MRVKWRQVIHWALIANFVLAALYGGYMVFFVGGGGRGPLLNRAPDTPAEMIIKRRLYAIETWTILFALSVYLAITEILPRRIAAARKGDVHTSRNREREDSDVGLEGRPSFSIGAFAIVFDERGRVLLRHRQDFDLWNLPGGGVESGELPTEAVIRETKEETGLDVVVEGDDLQPQLPPHQGTALFRIAQEALNNTVKHAQATQVTVTVEEDKAVVRMAITDDGVGFDPVSLEGSEATPHWGLLTMQERAQAAGARWQVESSPGQGTRISVDLTRDETTRSAGDL